ncbi:hypothetical protein [Phytoactinopolyspora endophytica]|uniref:hypothetical protein n=1 Tax=Phytoactinopolyspora endophytica TaxID=1642495 RepID=UPI00101D149A|nr:hypothetical protein [Phytoactinopolyspora endophytica]
MQPEHALDIGVTALSRKRYGTSILAFQVALGSFDDRIFSLALDELHALVNRSRDIAKASTALKHNSYAQEGDRLNY